jgi:hypothetical protein
MPVGRVAAIAAGAGALLWASLDSGLAGPPAPPVTSVALAVLALVFGGGAAVMRLGGRPERAPLLAGLAAGIGGYAILRLTLPG